MVMTKWLMEAHPELKGTPFDVEIVEVNNTESGNWIDWKFILRYVPRTNNGYNDENSAEAIQGMIESINNVR